MVKGNSAVDLLKLLRGPGGAKASEEGVRIVVIRTAAPGPVTLVFEGTKLALDESVFVIPQAFIPLQAGSKYFALPLAGSGAARRWGLIQKIN